MNEFQNVATNNIAPTCLVNGRATVYTTTCKNCHRTFSLMSDQVRWFIDRNLALPTHCVECRKIRQDFKRQYDAACADALNRFANKFAEHNSVNKNDEEENK